MQAFLRFGVEPPAAVLSEDEPPGSAHPVEEPLGTEGLTDEVLDKGADTDKLEQGWDPQNQQAGEDIAWDVNPPCAENIHDLLREAGVIVGFDEEAISKAVERATGDPGTAFSIEVATGTKAVPATTPSLEVCYRVESDELHGPAVEVIELVEPGRVLVQVHAGDPAVDKLDVTGEAIPLPDSPRIVLVAGKNANVTDDGLSVKAGLIGYPSITRSTMRTETRITVSVQPVVIISEDRMEATMLLYRPVRGADDLTQERLTKLMDDAGVLHGVMMESVKALLDLVHGGATQASGIVARGTPELPGEDARIEYALEPGPRPGSSLPGGGIDFRERLVFQQVDEGALIATKIPATQGSEGLDVYGEPRKPTPGMDARLEAEGDARHDKETREVRATKDGVLTLVGDNRIRVSAKTTINGDVDYVTGNVKSKGCVEVRGSVLNGFEVVAQGDVLIQGMVENARVESDANIMVTGGVKGRAAKLEAKGDVDVRFVESGRISSGGNVIVRQGLVLARVHAHGAVHCEQQSKVIGGQVIAGRNVSLGGSVGSGRSGFALVAAAVSPTNLRRFYNLQRELTRLEDAVQTFYSRFGSTVDNETIQTLRQELTETKAALERLDLQPEDSPAQLASIVVHGVIHSETILKIGNTELLVLDDYEAKRFVAPQAGQPIHALDL